MFEKYFQEEVAYLREHAQELAEAYPELAPLLGAGAADADVLRLLEGTAFLTGRIREKLDDDIPEFSQSLALLLYPHLTRPLPSASILELRPMASAMAEPHVVPAGTEFASSPVQGARCTFRSTSECVLAPVEIERVRLETHASGRQSIEVDLRSRTDKPLAEVLPAILRLHLTGEPSTVSSVLFAVVQGRESVVLSVGSAGTKELPLGPETIQWAGFDESEALLPLGHHVLPGYRLLEEYGILPAKFAFVDLLSLPRVRELDPDARAMTVSLRLARPLPDGVAVDDTNVRLHCVPIVNAFAANAEPIRVEPGRDRYLVRPAGLPPSHGEVYAVLKVTAVASGAGKQVVLPPLLDLGSPAKGASGGYVTHLAPSVTRAGEETLLSIVPPADLDVDKLAVQLLATNRGVAATLHPGDVKVHTASSPAVATFANIAPLTPHLPPPAGRHVQWRALAHTAMSLRALVEPAVLRKVVGMYDLPAMVDQQAARARDLRTDAIKDVRMGRTLRVDKGSAQRGVTVDCDLDDDGFRGPGDLLLFAAILERIFSEHVSTHSFTECTFHAVRSKTEVRWPPRPGNQAIL